MCFLVDTNSSLRLISEDVFKSLPVHLILEESNTRLTTAVGDLLAVQGKTNVTLSFRCREFIIPLVVGKFGIIEIESLMKYDVLIDASNGILHLRPLGELSLLRKDHFHNSCTRIHLAETVYPEGVKCSFRAR